MQAIAPKVKKIQQKYKGKNDPAALGAFDIATAQQFVKTRVFGVGVADTFMTTAGAGKIVIVIFVVLMCAAMWYMQFNNIRKNLPPESKQRSQHTLQKRMMW